MRVLLIHLFLIISLSLINSVKADDIRDLEIEGVSLGDSTLNIMTKKEIKETLSHKHTFFYKKKVFAVITTPLKSNRYDRIAITIKPNDQSFLIQAIEGIIYFNDDISGCLKKMKFRMN